MSRIARALLMAAGAATLLAGGAQAQLLGGIALPPINLPVPVGNVPVAGPILQNILATPAARQAINPTLDHVTGVPEQIAQSGSATLLELRRLRLQQLIQDNRAQLESDRGLPVRRGIIGVINPDPMNLNAALGAGFRTVSDEAEPELGLRLVQLAVPRGMSAPAGLRLLQRVAPQLQADVDHVYEPAGGSLAPVAAGLAVSGGSSSGRIIGMVDGGVASHPSLANAQIEQNGFAGSPRATGHGTAVASLLVGSQGAFRGAANGAQLYVADVYGGSRAAGSATSIVKALGWLAAKRAQVVNVSLVGPSNTLVERAVAALRSRGVHVVAAVGNDGPAAPPQYPASSPGVLAVTAVDARGRALPEAGRAAHLDFAAPGADMAAALPGQGYTRVRGTSFAAPLAAARLLAVGSPARLAAEARPGKGRVGRGIVCGDCRTDPRSVSAK
jgi:hypothetical protein